MSGIFAVAARGECAEILLYGTDYHSHLGTQYGGMAVLGERFSRQIHSIANNQFKGKFLDEVRHFHGNRGIGVVSGLGEQPIFINSRHGPFCLAANGFIGNADELAARVLAEGGSFSEMTHDGVNQTELAAKLVAAGDSIVDGIKGLFAAIHGSCSLVILHRNGVYAARDRFGSTPLVVGRRTDAWAVTTETSAFPNLGFSIAKFLDPGEVVLVTEHGMQVCTAGGPREQVCSFLWIYTGFPASSYDGVNTEIVRERCGRALARRDRDIEVDLVSGIPDSGLAHAQGYAMESGKPLRRPLVKYTPGYGRSYTPPSQQMRDLIATMKLIPIREVIESNRIVVCEDSIVRGTQLKNFTVNKLWENGAREIHVRPACPPLMFPCRYNVSTRTVDELVARRAIRALESRDPDDLSPYLDHRTEQYARMVDWICRDIGATTLRYQTLDDMVEAIGLPRERLCTWCWTGCGCD